MLAGRSLDIFDDLLASALAGASCLSHLPLFSGYDEPRILSYQIALFGPIGADVRHYIPGWLIHRIAFEAYPLTGCASRSAVTT